MTERKIDLEYKNPSGAFKIDFSLEGDIVLSVASGNMKTEDADAVIQIYRNYCEKFGKPFLHVMDITSFENAETESRQKMSAHVLGANSPLACLALCGGGFAIRMLFNLYGKISKIPMKMFTTREEALAWAKERGSR